MYGSVFCLLKTFGVGNVVHLYAVEKKGAESNFVLLFLSMELNSTKALTRKTHALKDCISSIGKENRKLSISDLNNFE